MNIVPSRVANATTASPAPADSTSRAGKLFRSGHALLPSLERGQPIGAADLRTILMNIFGGTVAS